ncbi:HNH endonuclease [Rhizophagus clarus]|uniref:HNH endonuclease n=1 Tax=Rhizophagus clarus TaxID=94130 RepID=A0A8H3M9E5_9GLOM|nr:HNH endonuclease [Rhizophagus clarus]
MHSKFQKLAFQNVVVGSKNFWWLALDVQYYEDHIEPKLNEEWREIELDSRKFRVSSLGRIQLTNGEITQGSLHIGHRKTAREGYLVHRLVALAFCPKEGKEYVNNIDGDSTNNNASNLEWIVTREFPSIAEAQRTIGINQSNIGVVCRGFRAYVGGYRWEYVKCNDT